jgi:B-box zinc finger
MSAMASLVTRCARHPETETALRCQSCETAICPRCMVQSPVGAKCPGCARVMKSPIYNLNTAQFLKSAGMALLGGIGMGIAWAYLLVGFSFGLLSILFGAGLGYAFTRILEWASGRKRGPVMIALAVAGIALAWGITVPINGFEIARYGLVAAAIGVYFSYQNLR